MTWHATRRNRGAEHPGVGWFIELRPKNEHFIDDCYESARKCFKIMAFLTLGATFLLQQLLKILEACLALLRTCPIDDLTQVPHPGKADLRMTTPCSHGLTAQRIRFPDGITEDDKKLIMAAGVTISMNSYFLSLG